MLIDTHAHLYYDQFTPDLDQIIQRAKSANLKAIINIGADYESSKKSLRQVRQAHCRQAQDFDGELSRTGKLAGIDLYTSIGIHPHDASRLPTDESIHENVKKLEQLYQDNTNKVVAIGECGLDYYFAGVDYSPSSLLQKEQISLQKKLFHTQIALAKKLNLPLIIHCRPSTHSADAHGRTEQGQSATSSGLKDAWDDIFVPELTGTIGVFHSFTGTEVEAKKILDLGYYLGLSCIVTYPKNEHLRQIIKWAPLDKIQTETDCPYLPPQSQRGQRNEPANVTEVIKIIAGIKGLSEEKVSRAIWQNAAKLFRLPTNYPS